MLAKLANSAKSRISSSGCLMMGFACCPFLGCLCGFAPIRKFAESASPWVQAAYFERCHLPPLLLNWNDPFPIPNRICLNARKSAEEFGKDPSKIRKLLITFILVRPAQVLALRGTLDSSAAAFPAAPPSATGANRQSHHIAAVAAHTERRGEVVTRKWLFATSGGTSWILTRACCFSDPHYYRFRKNNEFGKRLHTCSRIVQKYTRL